MIELSRNITFDPRLNHYCIAVWFDGENETLLFPDRASAYHEYRHLRRCGARLIPLGLDGSL